ncbi:hypothetical protein [Rufibacter quisquiliarum]|uniref:Uncharacterized protein n=1 Tax=Rufibacter quisquiliarum TaxID=1549639 RepID=A0A839GHH5_9BACT|nr:hypothetical protein [Rufibacter quisquiliarum]MBA9078332.1 hypothetical protein [Rufibacter quisquiliarum]
MRKDRRDWDRDDWYWHNNKPKLYFAAAMLLGLAIYKAGQALGWW